uniref:Heat shock protein 70 n=1 Tax=Panagrolaimus davidi TaxID=227884 RepID=A0A914QJ74_9BILA
MDDIPTYSIPKKQKFYDFSINAIGIDLGTSSCFAAVNRKNGIETVALDNTGERILPSYIGYEEAKVKCGKLVVERLGNYTKYTVFDSKRLIGQCYDEKLKDASWPFQIINENEFQRREPTTIVITIPAAFTESQKEATLTAAKLAGLDKVNLLPEPVAASFAYFIDRPLSNNATILLFDLGGGTLDICIFKVNNSQMQIISNTGDPNIGGRDFDKVLYDFFKKELLTNFNVDLENQERRKLDVEDFDASKEGMIHLTRKDFEAKTNKLTEKLKKLIGKALMEAKLQPHQINKVFRVGGSSRMPIVQQMLMKMFPIADHCVEENPDEVVARGAAYYSYHLASEGHK